MSLESNTNTCTSIIGGALMSFLPTTNRAGCLAGIYLTNAVVAPLAVFYNVSSTHSLCPYSPLTRLSVDGGQHWRWH
jgi:hypothetical protein